MARRRVHRMPLLSSLSLSLSSFLLPLLLALILLQLTFSTSQAAAEATTDEQQKCHCTHDNCLCCVQLNLTRSIDLGGPACAKIGQKDNNVTLNLSYAEDTHNATTLLGKLLLIYIFNFHYCFVFAFFF